MGHSVSCHVTNIIFRCFYAFGLHSEAIEDAKKAVERKADSLAAREALGMTLYADGLFEKALVEFHKVFRQVSNYFEYIRDFVITSRIRQTKSFEEWITRCEETIKSFLSTTSIDSNTVRKMINDKQTEYWRDILKTA